ncbi:MAG: enoyl-CoA hydratase/isomerase family protein [Nannocystaceae bacterium]
MRLAERRSASGTLWWTLDHERRRNAVHPDMLTELVARCEDLRGEVVVLRGAGQEAFSAGYDLTALDPQTLDTEGDAPEAALIAATDAMMNADATFIAALNGYAIGAGVELACACDMRAGVPHTSFRVPATRLGVVYHPRGVARIRQVVGESLARRMFLLDETIDATALSTAGALDLTVAPDVLEESCERWANTLRALPHTALRAHRELLRRPAYQGPRPPSSDHPDPESDEYEARRGEAYAALALQRRRGEAGPSK